MYTHYKVKANELNENFIHALKLLFGDKEIDIIINESSQEDETTYLLKSPANREHLFAAIQNINSSENLIAVNLKEWQQ